MSTKEATMTADQDAQVEQIQHIDMTPGSEAWRKLITASKVSAILGVSPGQWESRRSLWLKMSGAIPWDDGRNTAEKSRGHYLENGILDWWCDQHPEWATQTARQWLARRPDLMWAAATPDLAAWSENDDPLGAPRVVVDAKTSRDDAEWGTPGTDEVPLHYLAQMMWAMHLSGARVAFIALLTQFLDLREYRIDYDAGLAADIETQCHTFITSVSEPGAVPPLDNTQATWRAEKQLHPDIDRGKAVEIDEALARQFVAIKEHEADVRLIQSQIREAMGDARLATFGGVQIARRQPNAHGVSLVAIAKTLPMPAEGTEAA
jgi:predicted phage-related endonuclease